MQKEIPQKNIYCRRRRHDRNIQFELELKSTKQWQWTVLTADRSDGGDVFFFSLRFAIGFLGCNQYIKKGKNYSISFLNGTRTKNKKNWNRNETSIHHHNGFLRLCCLVHFGWPWPFLRNSDSNVESITANARSRIKVKLLFPIFLSVIAFECDEWCWWWIAWVVCVRDPVASKGDCIRTTITIIIINIIDAIALVIIFAFVCIKYPSGKPIF